MLWMAKAKPRPSPMASAVYFQALARRVASMSTDAVRVTAAESEIGSHQRNGCNQHQSNGRDGQGLEEFFHCMDMQSACLFCWRVHTPLQPFGPQFCGSLQSRPA